MELKPIEINGKTYQDVLLIEPYGIETNLWLKFRK